MNPVRLFGPLVVATLLVQSSLADTVPRYDVTSTCRKAVALAGGGTEGRSVDSCVAGEEAARRDLDKQWPKLPTGDRT